MAIVAQLSHASYFEFEEIEDYNLRKATNAVLETGQLTPIIKEELRLLIQSRRLQLGQDELTVTFSPPNRDEKSFVDPEKLTKRREQNRLAAKRFRLKWKTKYDNIYKEFEEQTKRNQELKFKVEKLTELRNKMQYSVMQLLEKKRRMND